MGWFKTYDVIKIPHWRGTGPMQNREGDWPAGGCWFLHDEGIHITYGIGAMGVYPKDVDKNNRVWSGSQNCYLELVDYPWWLH